MTQSYPNVNGFEYSFASIEINIDGTRYYGATSITYDDSLTPGRAKGTSTLPVGSTAGEWDGSASIEFNRRDADALIAGLGNGFGRVVFPIVVQYAEDGMPVVTDELPRVRISKASHSNSTGSDASKVSFDLFLDAPIIRNGYAIERDFDNSGTANV